MVDDEAVLLNVETGIYFGLDPIGAEIWKLIVDGTTEDEIVTRLSPDYDVSPEQLRQDVREFVDALESKGLVRTVRS